MPSWMTREEWLELVGKQRQGKHDILSPQQLHITSQLTPAPAISYADSFSQCEPRGAPSTIPFHDCGIKGLGNRATISAEMTVKT